MKCQVDLYFSKYDKQKCSGTGNFNVDLELQIVGKNVAEINEKIISLHKYEFSYSQNYT